MEEKFDLILDEYNEIEKKLSDPAVISDLKLMTKLNRKYSSLKDTVNLINEYKRIQKQLDDVLIMIKEESNSELIKMAKEELEENKKKLDELKEKLKIMLLPKDEHDEKNIIIEIRAGAGGDESSLFAAELFRMYSKFAESLGYKIRVISSSESSAGGFKEIIFGVEGDHAYSNFKYESGVHRVQRIPTTESQGRVHTSTVTVAVLPEADEVDLEIKPEDLRIDIFRASGPGGQSVNTMDSAVRITYLPTGMIVSCQDGKSQLKNKLKAMSVLRSRLLAIKEEEALKERVDNRKSQIGTGDRSEKIRTYNFPQDRMTDHRIHKNWSGLPKIMSGELKDIVETLTMEDNAKKLKDLNV